MKNASEYLTGTSPVPGFGAGIRTRCRFDRRRPSDHRLSMSPTFTATPPGTGSTGAHSVELVRGFAAHSSPNSPVRWNSRVTQHQSVCAPALQLPGGNAATRSADIGG